MVLVEGRMKYSTVVLILIKIIKNGLILKVSEISIFFQSPKLWDVLEKKFGTLTMENYIFMKRISFSN